MMEEELEHISDPPAFTGDAPSLGELATAGCEPHVIPPPLDETGLAVDADDDIGAGEPEPVASAAPLLDGIRSSVAESRVVVEVAFAQAGSLSCTAPCNGDISLVAHADECCFVHWTNVNTSTARRITVGPPPYFFIRAVVATVVYPEPFDGCRIVITRGPASMHRKKHSRVQIKCRDGTCCCDRPAMLVSSVGR